MNANQLAYIGNIVSLHREYPLFYSFEDGLTRVYNEWIEVVLPFAFPFAGTTNQQDSYRLAELAGFVGEIAPEGGNLAVRATYGYSFTVNLAGEAPIPLSRRMENFRWIFPVRTGELRRFYLLDEWRFYVGDTILWLFEVLETEPPAEVQLGLADLEWQKVLAVGAGAFTAYFLAE